MVPEVLVQEAQARVKTRVVWTVPANAHLRDIHEYVSESSARAADSQLAILLNAANSLGDLPEIGRPGRWRGTRELIVTGTPYIVAYRIRLATVEILAVIHCARRWPRRFSD